MAYERLSSNVFNCNVCHTRCDGKTVPQFDFERDVKFSEAIENAVIQHLNNKYAHLSSIKTTSEGYPDIEVRRKSNSEIACFIEIKGQARTFMSVARLLPASKLAPSETLALNLSDLERYFQIFKNQKIPVYLVWCLMRRPCITGTNSNSKVFYHQKLFTLKQIWQADMQKARRFKRSPGKGDVVNGEHKGVVVNYHFSINELVPGLPDLSNI